VALSGPRSPRSPCPWGKLVCSQQEPLFSLVPERCAHHVSTVTHSFRDGSMIPSPISFSLLRCSSSNSSRSPLDLPVSERLPILFPSAMLSGRGLGASCAHRLRLRQGRPGRQALVAEFPFVGQAFDTLLEKPLHPLGYLCPTPAKVKLLLPCQDRVTEPYRDLSENHMFDPILTGFWLCP
jgi:hypothetical protein